MKHIICIAVSVVYFTTAQAQTIYFPGSYYSDSTSLAAHLPTVAKQLIGEYKEADPSTYYDNRFRLQIVAKEYPASIKTLDTFSCQAVKDTGEAKGIAFHYRTYVLAATAYRQTANRTFGDYYQEGFVNAYRSLSARAKLRANNYFNFDMVDIKATLDAKISAQRESGKDSISIKDAVALCRSWCTWMVCSSTGKEGRGLLAKINNEKYLIDDSVLVAMPDGGQLSAIIVRKRDVTVPLPVVLMYNIYASPGDVEVAKEAATNGYVGIVANTRGKRLSKDPIVPFERDGEDAYNLIDWISKQPWCNGKVGMYGGSYLGFAQWSAAKHLHPALRTIVPQVSVGAGIDYPMLNGIFQNYMLQWIHFVTNNKLTDDKDFFDSKKWDSISINWYRKGLSFRSLDTLEGHPDVIFQRWLQHPGYDSYWQRMTPQKEEFAKINIPILTTTGYYDDDQLGALYYYRQYHRWNKNPDYYLIIGPYDHGGSQGYPKPRIGGYTIDSVANIRIEQIVFQWFDHVLKDSSLPAILKDRVNFEVMGKNEWRHVHSLDKMYNDSLVFYLGNTLSGKQYSLSKTKPVTPGFIAQTVDMTDRSDVRIKNGDIDAFPLLIDSVLNPEKEKLVFVSEPVDQPFAISGASTISILASINKKDIDLVVDLYEETPEGNYFALSEAMQRASYAKDRTKRQLLQPGKPETIDIARTFITSRQLQKGSRIVMTIGVNKSPSWQVNYGTGKDVSDETVTDAGAPFQIKWYNSSWIKLPILK